MGRETAGDLSLVKWTGWKRKKKKQYCDLGTGRRIFE
jgi:hypothetical protein